MIGRLIEALDEAVDAAAAAAAAAAERGAGSAHQRMVSSFPPGRQSWVTSSLWATKREMGASAAAEENGLGRAPPGVIEQLRNPGQLWGPCQIVNVVPGDAYS